MTEILDEAAVSEIEARTNIDLNPRYPTRAEQEAIAAFNYHASDDILALCATVKHLRQLVYLPRILPDDEEVTFQEDNGRLLREKLELQSQLEQVRVENVSLNEAAERERRHLNLKQSLLAGTQARLAQVEKELAEEKRLRTELKQIAQIGISEVSSVGTGDAASSTSARAAAEEILSTVLGFNELDDLAKLQPDNGNRRHVEAEIKAIIERHYS